MSLVWRVEVLAGAKRQLKKLDTPVAARIIRYLEKEVIAKGDPRRVGKALVGDLAGLWRYRVGDYRILCRIEDDALVVLVVELGHRGSIYTP